MSGVKRSFNQTAIGAAIAANEQPRVPKSARGLVLGVPGGKARRLMDSSSTLTDTGQYYYETTAQQAPAGGLDYAQQTERRGNRTTVKLLDGRRAGVRSWDPVRRELKYTKLRRDFYKDAKDSYVVTFPVKEMHIEDGEIVWEKDTVLKSTAVDLGEITLPTLMPEAEQLAEVKRCSEAFVGSLPEQDGWGLQ